MAVRRAFDMRRVRDARIARLGARLNDAAAGEIHDRCRLRAIAVIGAAVRCALAGAGVDPARAVRLREAEIAEAALAALPDTPELVQADSAAAASPTDPDALDNFLAETLRLARRYETDCEIDLAAAPLADLFAWCIARSWIELQHDCSKNLLLICCKSPSSGREANPTDPNLASETMGLDPPNPDGATGAREFCC
jgi:hypothetical protein